MLCFIDTGDVMSADRTARLTKLAVEPSAVLFGKGGAVITVSVSASHFQMYVERRR